MKEITAKDMRDYMTAAAIFSNGQPEDFYKSLTLVEDVAKRGLKPKMVDPKDVPDDALICQIMQRAGGGYTYQPGELDESLRAFGKVSGEELLQKLLGPFKDAYYERDWSRYGRSIAKVVPELQRAIDEKIYSYMTCCTSSSQGVVAMYVSGITGQPFIDGDVCGTAMSPHLDTVAKIEYLPIRAAVSPYGETIVVKDSPATRAGYFLENVHRASGCWFIAMASSLARMKEYRRATVKNRHSRLIKVGATVREAREKGRDPAAAFMKAAPAHKLFEGVVERFILQKTGGQAHGDFYINGTGEFKGHKFRVYFNMENRVSWLDGKPYVTIPDINGVVDSKTCECQPVLDHDGVRIVDGLYNGKDVTVLGIANDKIWYELPGAIDAVNAQLKAYGFPDVKHRPIKEVLG